MLGLGLGLGLNFYVLLNYLFIVEDGSALHEKTFPLSLKSIAPVVRKLRRVRVRVRVNLGLGLT